MRADFAMMLWAYVPTWQAGSVLFEPKGAPTRPRPGHEWSDEIDDAVRGLASGFLVGIPVVFTVDTWWLGDQIGPLDALVLLGVSYVLTLAAVYWIGFHRDLRRGWQYFADALEALALATLSLVAVFWALGQIGRRADAVDRRGTDRGGDRASESRRCGGQSPTGA